MIRRPPRSTQYVSSAASDVYKRQKLFYSSCAAMESSARLFVAGCHAFNSPQKRIPGMLYHVQIWRTCWQVFSDDVVVLFLSCDDSSTKRLVATRIKFLGWRTCWKGEMMSCRISSLFLAAVTLPLMTSKAILQVKPAHAMMDLSPCDFTILTQSSL